MEEVNYVGEPYGNTYNPSWRNHPNLSWKDQQKPQQGFNNNQGGTNQNRFDNRPPFPSSQGNMETFKQNLSDLAILVSSLTKTTHSFINETRSSIRNLEVQVGKLSKWIPETHPETLPRNTEVNPRGKYKAITMEDMAKSEENGKALNASEEAFTGRSTPTMAASLALNTSEEPLTGHLTPILAEELALNASQGVLAGGSMPKHQGFLALNANEEPLIGHSTSNHAAILGLNASKEPLTGHSMPITPRKLALNASKDIPTGCSTPRRLEELVFSTCLDG